MKLLTTKHWPARGEMEENHTSRESGKGRVKSLLKNRSRRVDNGGRQRRGQRLSMEIFRKRRLRAQRKR